MATVQEECSELFDTRHHRYVICTGEDLSIPLKKVNAYRTSWGLPPLEDDGRERGKQVVHSGQVDAAKKPTPPKKQHAKQGCTTCGDEPKPFVLPISQGPGTELMFIYQSYGAPSCPSCQEMALRMDAMGSSTCLAQIDELAREILPRARAWVNHYKMGSAIPDSVIEWRIKKDIKKANEKAGKPPAWKKEDCSTLLNRTEIIIKSHQRFDYLLQFVESIRERYPTIKIRVVDDSGELNAEQETQQKKILDFDVAWETMPYDSGLPAGRNLGVSRSDSEYIIMCDDDYLFNSYTSLEAMLLCLTKTDLDLCGGLIQVAEDKAQNWCGYLSFKGRDQKRWLSMSRPGASYERVDGIRYKRVDVTFNFFAATRKFLLENPYDEQFKITTEHLDSYMTWWQAGAKIGFTFDSMAFHQKQEMDPEYRKKRRRNFSYQFLKKWGIREKRTVGPTYYEGLL